MAEGRIVEGPTVEGLMVQGRVIRTIHQGVQDPIKSTVLAVERNSSSKSLHPVTRSSCVWNASKNREVNPSGLSGLRTGEPAFGVSSVERSALTLSAPLTLL